MPTHTIGNVRKLEGGEVTGSVRLYRESQEEGREKTEKTKTRNKKRKRIYLDDRKKCERLAFGSWTFYSNLGHQSQPSFRGGNISNQHEGHWHNIPSSWYCQRPPISSKFGSWDMVAIDFHTKVEREKSGKCLARLWWPRKASVYIYLCVYQAHTTPRPLGINRLWSDSPAVNGRRREREERENDARQKSIGRTKVSFPGMIFAFSDSSSFFILSCLSFERFPRNLYGKRGVSHINCGSWIKKPQNGFVKKFFFFSFKKIIFQCFFVMANMGPDQQT